MKKTESSKDSLKIIPNHVFFKNLRECDGYGITKDASIYINNLIEKREEKIGLYLSPLLDMILLFKEDEDPHKFCSALLLVIKFLSPLLEQIETCVDQNIYFTSNDD